MGTIPEKTKEGMKVEIIQIAQGAESTVFLIPEFLRSSNANIDLRAIVKQRKSKGYRNPILDKKLTRERTMQEVRCIRRVSAIKGIAVPRLYLVEGNNIYMQYIKGIPLKKHLENIISNDCVFTCNDAMRMDGINKLTVIGNSIGRDLSLIHSNDIIHGDLTTSNLIVTASNEGEISLTWIDFGLGATTTLQEDKAIDLYILERSLESSHSSIAEHMMEKVIEGYTSKGGKADVISRLKKVRMRGRKRIAFG